MAVEQPKPSSAGGETLTSTQNRPSSKHSDETLSSTVDDQDIQKTTQPFSNPDRDVEQGVTIVGSGDEPEDQEKSKVERIVSVSESNIVDWNDSEDIRRPINWTDKKKWLNCSIISALTFLTPLASSMVAPAVPIMMQDFRTDNGTIGSFIVSIYILGYAIGPLFIAPLSETYGRMPVYHVCNVMFIIWNMACALAPTSSVGALLVFRLFAGLAGSCPITIFAGSIADVFVQEKRGGAMAICAMGPLIGPVVGPVCGGFLAEAAGWRWVFWVITIASGVTAAGSFTFQRETYEPVLLQRLTDQMKKESGNKTLRSRLDTGVTKQERFKRAIIRPTKMLVQSPIVLLLSIYVSVVYGYLYLLFTTLTPVYEGVYHFKPGPVGLVFLGIGLGSFVGLVIFGGLSDRLLKHLTAKSGTGEMKPEYRLPPMLPGCLLIPIGLFWYGWSVEKQIHWIMGIIGTLWVGAGMIAVMMCSQTYLVDAYTVHAASAIAANTVLRSLVGALLPLAGPKMYATLGLGWGNSLLGFIALALSPIAWIFYRYGEKIRKRCTVEF